MAEEKPDFNGSWTLVKSENFEQFLAASGVNWFLRKIASKSPIQVHINQDGDSFVIRSVIAIRTQEDRFTVNEPFSSLDINGVKIKVTPSWEGNAVVLQNEPMMEAVKEKSTTIKREIIDGKLLLTMLTGNIVCKRWFDQVQ